jgi:hypothetical protein
MTQMICMANSIREGDRCVAGIEVGTGRWIRPVPPAGGGIPTRHVNFGGHWLEPLDIVELNVQPPQMATRYQCENCVMPAYDWQIVGRAEPIHLLPCCERTTPILHTDTDRVAPALLEQLPPAHWRSLQLVRANPVTFGQDYWNRRRWRADFQDEAGNHYSLKVTDPLACDRLARGEEIGQDCILTISLIEPWTHNAEEKPPTCYKLVAAVVEL